VRIHDPAAAPTCFPAEHPMCPPEETASIRSTATR
jgi:hypothetical protein